MVESIIKSFDIWTDAQGVKFKGRVKSIDNISLEGIAHLRELILELAVRGKLVPQDPNEEPASDLLKKIEKEKEKLVKEGKIRKGKPLPSITEEEKPFELPVGWKWVRLPQICDYGPGRTPSTNNPDLWAMSGDGIPWVSISDMVDNGFINETSKYVSIKAAETVFQGNIVPSGTMLMSFKLTIGKISILNIDAYHNEAIISIKPFKGVSDEYIFNFLPTRARAGKSKNALMGDTLNSTSLALLLTPLPPLSEQHRIVAKVEELMSLCDELEREKKASFKTHQTLVAALLQTLTDAKDADEVEAAWQRLAPHFDTLFCTEDSIGQLKQTIMHLAIMGRLVKQDPADEPASVLLEKIEEEKEKLVKEGKIKREKPLPEISYEEKPFALPNGWQWVKLGQITLNVDYGTSEKATDKGEVPILRMGNIQEGKVILQNLKYVQKSIKDLPRLYLKQYDIIFNRTNSFELVGKCGIFQEDTNTFTLASYLIRVSLPLAFVSVDFLNYYINSTTCRTTQIEPQITQQTGQANFSGSKLKEILLPFPPLFEQKRIVAKVEELMALCDNLKGRLLKSQEIQNTLSKTIVENAIE